MQPVTHRAGADAGDVVNPIVGADLTGTGPGSLISATTLPVFSSTAAGQRMRAARVVYRSTNADTGQPTQVSGSVFVPLGDAPAHGWPVIGLAHGTTGIDQPCAPSQSNDLGNHVYWVSKLIDLGFAVALTDYEGLGNPGIHPYLDSPSAGYNVIDSVRALRQTFPNVSPLWAALGGSQGGGAAWAADEEAAAYAPDLYLVGAAVWAPAADIVGLVDKSIAGTLTREQRGLFAAVIESLARRHSDLNRDDYRRGAAVTYWDGLWTCAADAGQDRSTAISQTGPHDIGPATPQSADKLRGYLQKFALPKRKLSAPLSIIWGDRDEYIDPAWTTVAIVRACQLGGNAIWQQQQGLGHGGLDVEPQIVWLGERFSGKPAASYCT